MLAVGLALLGPGAGNASSHREAPIVSGEPLLDNTDVYAFVSPDKPNHVNLIANWIPFEEPNGGPNFYGWGTNVQYDINIDNDGDAEADVTYRWVFEDRWRNRNTFLANTGPVTSLDDKDLNFRQFYKLEKIVKGRTVASYDNIQAAPSYTGRASFPNYGAVADSAIKKLPNDSQTFAGQADDPFFLDLRVFDLLYGGDLKSVGQDTVKGYNVNTLAIQVPKAELALRGDAGRNPVVGIWSTTSRQRKEVVEENNRRDFDGGFRQVSRLGMPLVNEVVIPVGKKDEFNATQPKDDGKFLKFVTEPEVPKLVQQLYWIPAPATPRKDLVQVFLTGVAKGDDGPVQADLNSHKLNKDADPKKIRPSEQLRLNMAVPPSKNPNRLGVVGGDLAGFPNGRRLADDALDVTLQAAEGVLLPGHPKAVDGLGDGVDQNNVPFRQAFPYVALPNTEAVNTY
ncbi:hypothetical protein Val02_26080 [Virgisporangium aliadipatigenens]|uniref:DUF4331 domain-containing protein n=1 Tax=Virgisporangium aliadipatigenens TaxID=741659 RepID=A0A8J3YJV4_9ACTN|nr:hypothetical protein Val02_26080 [Virgisporangium aliadipatigenens]